jgi:hypothetical protein
MVSNQTALKGLVFGFQGCIMDQIPIKTTNNACGGEGVLATGKIFTLAGREHPLLSRSIADLRNSTTWLFPSIERCSPAV